MGRIMPHFRGFVMPALADCEPSVSLQARERFLHLEGRPFFLSDWRDVLMTHFRVDPTVVQAETPFPLDLHDGHAYVSLVAFEMRRFRLSRGGRSTVWLTLPVARHSFLNVRTYVVHRGEPGIYFLGEWLSNRLAVLLGPSAFGLPYRFGRLRYDYDQHLGTLAGVVTDAKTASSLIYSGSWASRPPCAPSPPGSLTEFLMERYTAYTYWRGLKRMFRIWHEPWPQVEAKMRLGETSLLTQSGTWWRHAEYIGANYSPGVNEIWMGRPRLVLSRREANIREMAGIGAQ